MITDERVELTPGQIIERHQEKAPVDVSAIALDLGLNVWEMWDLPQGVSGKIFLDPLYGGTSKYSIGLNAKEGLRRKRFTLAHEIAHFILHKEQIGFEHSDDQMYRGKMSTRQEVEANKLAAKILMPLHLIAELRKLGISSARDLADKFIVSEAAMVVRLDYLGIASPTSEP